METGIVHDERHRDTYYVRIGDRTIQTTWAESSDAEFVTMEWLSLINKIYRKSKKKKSNKTLIVGLAADRSRHYADGNYYSRFTKKDPIDVLQLCVGNHCLIYELDREGMVEKPPKCLRDFLHDNRTVVVGLGMEKVAKQLAEDYELPTSKAVELRGLVKGVAKKDVGLEKLGKIVLGEEWSVVRPSGIKWWKDWSWRLSDREFLSDDKILYGTFDALLAYEMGVKLMGDDPLMHLY